MILLVPEKKIDVLKIIDFEKFKQALVDKPDSAEFHIKRWKKKKKENFRELVILLTALMPELDEEGHNAEKVKLFLESIRDRDLRKKVCEFAYSYDVLSDWVIKKWERFARFLKENNLP